MNRNNWILKLAVTALVGLAVVASPAAWAKGKKEKAAAVSQPSAQETVEFINGLLACDVPRVPNVQRNADTIELGGSQRSTLAVSDQGAELIEDWFTDYKSMSGGGAERGEAGHNSVSISWGELVLAKSVESDVELRCNPQYGECISTQTKHASVQLVPNIGAYHCSRNHCVESAKSALISAPTTQKNKSSWTINFCRPEDAVRGAKAINHLIQMHGGKASLF